MYLEIEGQLVFFIKNYKKSSFRRGTGRNLYLYITGVHGVNIRCIDFSLL
jgi:hypothetical protein